VTNAAVSERGEKMDGKIYDVIVIGGGPAGLTSIIYARRAELSVLLIEKISPGGTIAVTAEVENYPGGILGESGSELAGRMAQQAEHFGYDKASGEVTSVDFSSKIKNVNTASESFQGKSVIIATGCVASTLDIPGEKEYTGRGVSYCATCDGPFFRDLDVIVVGGGNTAVEEAVFLAKIARKVTIIHRRDELRAAAAIQKKAKAMDNIEFLFDSVVKEIKGGDMIEALVVENVKSKELQEITVDPDDGMMGIFILVGQKPQTSAFTDILKLEKGYIVTDENMNTDIPGVFAAGDVCKKELRQVVTAAADGAIAAMSAERYIES